MNKIKTVGLLGGGVIGAGWAARCLLNGLDVVVFDPDTVGDQPLQRVYDFPAGADRLISEARGISNVIVNGTVIREHGADAVPDGAPLPGQLLRGGAAA